MKNNIRWALILLALSTLACEPVITVGYGEMLVITLLFLVLLAPSIIRFIKRINRRK